MKRIFKIKNLIKLYKSYSMSGENSKYANGQLDDYLLNQGTGVVAPEDDMDHHSENSDAEYKVYRVLKTKSKIKLIIKLFPGPF